MAGYLGKISAVVSVNTGDFTRKLQQCGADVSRWADRNEAALKKSAAVSQRAFGTIYTEVQKLERALKAASALELSGLKTINVARLGEAADKMRTIHEVASQLSTPLSKAVAELESMSMVVRSTLHQSMERAQAAVEGVQTSAELTGKVTSAAFNGASRDVDRFTDSLRHAKDAMSEASKMGGSKGFRFQNAGLYDEMQRGGSLYSKASALPARQLTPELSRLLARQQMTAAAAAQFSTAAQASPSPINTAGLRESTRALEAVNNEIEKVIAAYDEETAAIERSRVKAEDASKAKIAAAERLLSIEQQYKQAITGQSQSIDQLRGRYNALTAAAAKLPSNNRAAAGKAMAGDVSIAQRIISDEDTTQLVAADQALARAEAAVATEANKVTASEEQAAKAKKDAADAAALLARQSATLAALEARRAQIATGEAQTIDQLDAKYAALIGRLARLPETYRAIASAAIAADAAMVETVIAEGKDSDVSAASAEVASIEKVVAAQEDLAAKANESRKATEALQDRLSRLADSIGDPSQPIDKAAAAVSRMNTEIAKIKDGGVRANAERQAEKIKTALANESTRAGGPRTGRINQITGAAKGLGDQAEAVNNAPKPRTANDIFGPAVGSRASQIDQLKSKIINVQGELEKLPVPLQVAMRPELEKIRRLFMNLGPNSTAKEIRDATREAKLFGDQVMRQSQAMKFGGSFGKFLDDTSAKKYEAELSAVQSAMAQIGATANGPTAAAINKYRAALEQASLAGTLGTDATRDKMRDLVAEIEKAVVAEGKLTKTQAKAVFGGIKRSGDVGRMGADKAGLALNQLAFAVDDFMSASGGVEMKIRAISNNLTQMAFVLGSTTGLWIALGAVIASQAAIAIYKFATGGKTAEDVAKALNETLSKQKSIAEDLAGAYRDLAKSITLSGDAQRGMEGATSRGAIATANTAARKARLTGVSGAVIGEMATQASIQRKMESTSEIGLLLFRNEQLKLSKARQGAAEATARRSGGGNPEDLASMRMRRTDIVQTIDNFTPAKILDSLGLSPTWNIGVKELAKELEDLEAKIRSAEDAFADVADKMALQAVDAAQIGKLRIESASAMLADAISSGVPGARELQNTMDSLSLEMSSALSRLADASAIDDQVTRKRETAAARDDISSVAAKTADLISSAIGVSIKAAFASPGSSEMLGQIGSSPRFAGAQSMLVGSSARLAGARTQLGVNAAEVAAASADANRVRSEGQRNILNAEAAARAAAEQRDSAERLFEADDSRVAAARAAQAAAELELEAQKKAAAAADQAAQANVAAAEAARDKAQADVDAAMAADKAAAAFAKAAMGIEQSLERTRKIGAGGLSSAEQRADLAQREFTDRPTEANRRKRDQAERDLRAAREQEAKLQASLDTAAAEAQGDERVKRASEIIRSREEQIAKIKEEAALAGRLPNQADIESRQNEIAAAERARADAVAAATRPEREALDQFAAEQQRKTEFAEANSRARVEAAKATERGRVRQGREDAMADRDRRVLQASQEAENMAAAAGEFANPAERKAFVQQFFDNKAKESMKNSVFGQLADERTNALLGGPSRQALEATDVASSEGQRELNRLLRGDDASRDVNFAEMQKQTDLLAVIADGIKAATGIVVDFR